MPDHKTKLYIETSAVETRAALVKRGGVQHFWFSSEGPQTDEIHVARVKTASPSAGGAFLELEDGAVAFLSANAKNMPAEGKFICVQIKRPALGGKAAFATREITLETPLMQWHPVRGKRKLAMAPGIKDVTRVALNEVFDGKGFKGELIIRPVAEKMDPKVLLSSFVRLRMAYDEMMEIASDAVAARLLSFPFTPAQQAVAFFIAEDPQEIIFTQSDALIDVKNYLETYLGDDTPELTVAKTVDLFEQAGLEEVLEQSFARTVTLPEGGRIVIDETEAFTAIDLDVAATQGQSQRGAIMKATRDAIPVIFDELTRRHIGGQVVIDFPALAAKTGGQLLSALKEEAKKHSRMRVSTLSDTGLCVITLPRREGSLLEMRTQVTDIEPLPGRVFADHVIAAKAFRALEKALAQETSARFEMRVASRLSIEAKWSEKLAARYGARFTIISDETLRREIFNVRPTG